MNQMIDVIPALYKLPENKDYEMDSLESVAASFATVSFTVVMNWPSMVCLALAVTFIVRQRQGKLLLKLCGLAVFLYCLSIYAENPLRKQNRSYQKFYSLLQLAQENPRNETVMKELSKYDFEFWALPSQFNMTNPEQSSKEIERNTERYISTDAKPFQIARRMAIYIAYPGLLENYSPHLYDVLKRARGELMAKYGIRRIKLVKKDGEEIEAFYVDRRNNDEYKSGNTLVICSEGNAGYPEIGTPETPLAESYSVIGWHHPGFQGSTGLPFPENEQSSMECIMNFAVNHLGFKEKDIILYSWSIGGYVSSWAAMTYPGIKSLILDATFDSLDPLVKKFAPTSIYGFLPLTSVLNLDLNNVEHLKRYNGSVRLIRRTRDEIISTDPIPNLRSNRGTFLLIELLKHRYPNLFKEELELHDFLSKRQKFRTLEKAIDSEKMLIEYMIEKNGRMMIFPSDLGKDILDAEIKKNLLYYLANKYADDFQSGHNNPLPSYYFKEAWKETDLLPH